MANKTTTDIYDNCIHEWQDDYDSQFHSEKFTAVTCKKCGVHGERNEETGYVFYPAT